MAATQSRCAHCGDFAAIIRRMWRGLMHKMCVKCWKAKEAADQRLAKEVRK